LAEFLTELQAELSKARSQAETDDLEFSVDGVTLDVDISYTLTQSPESPTRVKPEFWVLGSAAQDATVGAGAAQGNMQHLSVRLTPRLVAADMDEPKEVAPLSPLPRAALPDAEEMTNRTTKKPD
jgi:hypothetical protein